MFCDFTISIPDSILHSILDPPGLPQGSLLAPKMLETCLEIPPGRPKSRSKDLFFRLQEAKKRGPKKGPKKGPVGRVKLGSRWNARRKVRARS